MRTDGNIVDDKEMNNYYDMATQKEWRKNAYLSSYWYERKKDGDIQEDLE
jgi:hypothetical protein